MMRIHLNQRAIRRTRWNEMMVLYRVARIETRWILHRITTRMGFYSGRIGIMRGNTPIVGVVGRIMAFVCRNTPIMGFYRRCVVFGSGRIGIMGRNAPIVGLSLIHI